MVSDFHTLYFHIKQCLETLMMIHDHQENIDILRRRDRDIRDPAIIAAEGLMFMLLFEKTKDVVISPEIMNIVSGFSSVLTRVALCLMTFAFLDNMMLIIFTDVDLGLDDEPVRPDDMLFNWHRLIRQFRQF